MRRVRRPMRRQVHTARLRHRPPLAEARRSAQPSGPAASYCGPVSAQKSTKIDPRVGPTSGSPPDCGGRYVPPADQSLPYDELPSVRSKKYCMSRQLSISSRTLLCFRPPP